MNSKHLWFWLLLALALLGIILVKEQLSSPPHTGPRKVLPGLKAEAVTEMQIQFKGQLEIRAQRTNGTWELTAPIAYPAQALSIDNLLATLERLTSAAFISARERQRRPKADEEDGLAPPRVTILIHQGSEQTRIWIGAPTAPGDQVFIQVDAEGVHVVDADWLKALSPNADAWRDTSFVNLAGLSVDHLAVTNGAKVLEFRRDPAIQSWRIVTPPIQARADASLLDDLIRQLERVRVIQFLSDDPKLDLEPLGLMPAELQIGLGLGTNRLALLQFGKSPTNDASQVYARRSGQRTVVTVGKDLLTPWFKGVDEFRDPHLLSPLRAVNEIEVHGLDQFTLQRQTNLFWRIVPQNLVADAETVKDLLSTLSTLRIVEFTKEAATPQDLVPYGLATPSRQYWLRSVTTNAAGQLTNCVLAELAFGTNRDNKVYVRRADESGSVYAVASRDFFHLPVVSWQMRERRLWDVSETNVVSVTIRQGSKQRQLLHKGPHQWAIAPGSTGVLDNDLAVEESVKPLCHLTAPAWLARGPSGRAEFGFTEDSHRVTLEVNDGRKLTLEFARKNGSGPVFAAVTLDNESWIFEFPAEVYAFVGDYLSIPPAP